MEIKSVVNSLKSYRPTKIALEFSAEHNDEFNKDYQAFLLGNYQLTGNEYHQIGFRLAKAMNHNEVFAVDWNRALDHIPDMEEWVKENGSEVYESMIM
jgi:hypothetical protein